MIMFFFSFVFYVNLQSAYVHTRLRWVRILLWGILAAINMIVFFFFLFVFIFYACDPVNLQSMYVHTRLHWTRILLQGIITAINAIMCFSLFVFIFYAHMHAISLICMQHMFTQDLNLRSSKISLHLWVLFFFRVIGATKPWCTLSLELFNYLYTNNLLISATEINLKHNYLKNIITNVSVFSFFEW